jgi:multimeric flavodoxin WrbA
MKRVCAYIGSPLGDRSNTYRLTMLFLEALKRHSPDLECRIFTPANTTVRYCTGCWTCMTKGWCPQDETDDMKTIKEAMQAADLIVLGSPVYIMNVSGQMKTFLDRLPSWFHRFPFAGKLGVSVVTTGGGGLEDVQEYLGMLMIPLGIRKVGELGAIANLPGVICDTERARNDAERLAVAVAEYFSGVRKVASDVETETIFSVMKSVFGDSANASLMAADCRYWQETELSDCESFEEVLERFGRRDRA